MALRLLSSATVRLLSSSQVITSVHAVVKELLENSLDAKATNVEIKLENYGLDLIEVRDNGTGIKKEDTPYMALPHYTSKLTSMDDLTSLESYGFRGEALTSVAAVSTLSITTCTEADDIALTYTIDHSGQVIATKPSHLGRGTTVSVTNLFKNVPVRKQYYRSQKRCKEDLKKVEEVMLAFGITHPRVRFVFKHNKTLVWQKMQTSDFKTNLQLVLGSAIMQQLVPISYQSFDPMLKVHGYVPKLDADLALVSRTTADKLFLIVNNRPVAVKPVIQLIRQAFVDAFPSQSGRYPVAMVCIDVLPADLDVNLEPNKTAVLFHNMEFIASSLSSLLSQVYSSSTSSPDEVQNNATDENLFEQEQRPPTLRLAASGPESGVSSNRPGLDNSSGHPSHELDQGNVGADSQEKRASDSSSSSSDFSHNHVQPGHYCGRDGHSGSSVYDEGSVAESGKDHAASPDTQHFSTPEGISYNEETRENGRLLQPESFELLDISDFEDDVDDYHSDASSLHIAGLTPRSTCREEESSDHADTSRTSLNTSQTSHSSNHAQTSLNTSQTSHSSNRAQISLNTSQTSHSSNHAQTSLNTSQTSHSSNHAQTSLNTSQTSHSSNHAKTPPNTSPTSHSSNHAQTSLNTSQASLKQVNLLEWSRGEAVRGSPEETVEPVVMLRPPAAPSSVPTPKPAQSKLAYKGPPPIYDLINSKPVKRKEPSSVSNSCKKRKSASCSDSGTLPSLLDRSKLKLTKQSDVADVESETVACNVSKIAERKAALSSSEHPEVPDAVIGYCTPPGVWLVLVNKNIACFNVLRASESVLYRRLFENHVLPQEHLDSPITLDESMLGGFDNLAVLLSLKSERNSLDGCYYFCDHNLTMNGFKIQQTQVNGHPCLRLTHMCTMLPTFGLQDLRELLGKMRACQHTVQHGTTSSNLCRPTKVEQFLKRESTRMAKARLSFLQKSSVEDLFADVLSEPKISSYFHNICSISED